MVIGSPSRALWRDLWALDHTLGCWTGSGADGGTELRSNWHPACGWPPGWRQS